MDGSGPHYGNFQGTFYYIECPDDDRFYRKVFVKQNPFSFKLQARLYPPERLPAPKGLHKIPRLMASRLLRN